MESDIEEEEGVALSICALEEPVVSQSVIEKKKLNKRLIKFVSSIFTLMLA